MIKMQDLKEGDIVQVKFEGQEWEGIVKDLDNIEKKVCVQTPVQEFWFGSADLFPVPLDEEQLVKLNFDKQENEDGSVKYLRGPFRIYLPVKGDFSRLEVYYREDRRHLNHRIAVHELQNHYHQMTKVDLTRGQLS